MRHALSFENPVRKAGLAAVAIAVLTPVALILYQSFLDRPFFMPNTEYGFGAYAYVLSDPEFLRALRTSVLFAFGMVVIALPLGSALAFLIVRTDLPGRTWIEPFLLSPIFLSSLVLGFGYVVTIGPVGFLSLWFQENLNFVPWNLYSLSSLVLIAGLSHVPHVYLYVSSALRNVNPEVEEAARVAGAGLWRAATTISLPLVTPALAFSGTLVYLLGIEVFGLVLVLGDQTGIDVLTTYLYKITNLFGTPTYHLMAVVSLAVIALTLPLVLIQRYAARTPQKYVTVRGKGLANRPLPLGPWRWVAFALVMLWLGFTVVLPLAGVILRAFVSSWGFGVRLLDALTVNNFVQVLQFPSLVRAILNTILLATVGGALTVAIYTAIALIAHGWKSRWASVLDFLIMLPRAVPGLIAGLAFLWIFLFIPVLTPLRGTLVSLWIAYTIVWLAYGMRIITAALYQISPELEETARVAGASQMRVYRDVTIPLVRIGLLTSWILIFMTFCREYSTGVYLLGPNTEVLGAMIVAMFASGGLDLIAALSLINVLLIGLGVLLALRLGVRPYA